MRNHLAADDLLAMDAWVTSAITGAFGLITGWVVARQSEKKAERLTKAEHLASYNEKTVSVLTNLRLILEKLKPATFSRQAGAPKHRATITKNIQKFERQEEPLMRVTVGHPTAEVREALETVQARYFPTLKAVALYAEAAYREREDLEESHTQAQAEWDQFKADIQAATQIYCTNPRSSPPTFCKVSVHEVAYRPSSHPLFPSPGADTPYVPRTPVHTRCNDTVHRLGDAPACLNCFELASGFGIGCRLPLVGAWWSKPGCMQGLCTYRRWLQTGIASGLVRQTGHGTAL